MSVSSEYMTFTRHQIDGRKTPMVEVRSKSSGVTLGWVKWYGPWRQFCFFPAQTTIFNTGCMTDIQNVIAELAGERRAARQSH